MPIFNLHNGLMRFRAPVGTGHYDANGHPGYRMVHIDKSPKRLIQMGSIRDGKTVEYRADQFGNVEIDDPVHMNAMRQLGYPMYAGGEGEVRKEDLIWPDIGNTDCLYDKQILESISKRLRKG